LDGAYLAGLAALSWQVNPALEPKQVVRLWLETAAATAAGPVVNPAGFNRVGKGPA